MYRWFEVCEQYSHLQSNDKVLILTLVTSECYKCWHLLTLHPLPTDLLEILTIAHHFCVAGHLWMCIYLLCRQQPTWTFLIQMLQACYDVQEPLFPSPPPWTLDAWCCFCTDCSLSIASWIFLPRNSYFFRTIFLYSSSSRSRIRKKLFSSGRVNASH